LTHLDLARFAWRFEVGDRIVWVRVQAERPSVREGDSMNHGTRRSSQVVHEKKGRVRAGPAEASLTRCR
jgi:hypothetical protein